MMRGGKAKRLGMAIALIAGAASSVAEAQVKPPLRCYAADFFLEPITFEPGARWIPEDDPIFETRLLPLQLFEVEQPVIVGGITLLRSGDQLIGMRSKTATRCNFPQLKEAAIANRDRICVFDPDGDGVFDRIHTRSRGGANWFAMAWEHPKEGVQTIPAVSMKVIDPATFRGGPRIRYGAFHIPLRRKPRDGSPPYYEAFTGAALRGNDGLNWPMTLSSPFVNRGLLKGDTIEHQGLSIKVEDVAAEKTLISYEGNFKPEPVRLPFLNSYEHKCDTLVPRLFR
jgi:hypothetical protein